MGYQIQLLVNNGYSQTAGRENAINQDVAALEEKLASVRQVNPGHDFGQRGLARPVFPNQSHHFPHRHIKVNLPQGLRVVESL
jgi:hypothetical protein